jgi:hypothetical protein
MLLACWKNNRLEKSVVQNIHQKWLVKMVSSPKLVSSPKKFPFGMTDFGLMQWANLRLKFW